MDTNGLGYALTEQQEKRWIIWSNEHGAWWAPNESGYVESRTLAGRYSFENACAIVAAANKHHSDDSEKPYEMMVLEY